MTVSREDVRDAYRAVLDREPESESTISAHMGHADKRALLRSLLTSDEGANRNALNANANAHEHHTYSGYAPGDLAILHSFKLHAKGGSRGFVTSFLGVRYRIDFAPGLPSFDGKVEGFPEPVGSHQGETAEFIGTLRAVLDAGKRFRMLECGAGYGTWMACSHAAAAQRRIPDIRVYGVEADEGHFAFLRQHMADNGITAYTAFPCAIGAGAGTAEWAISDNPAADYGGGLHRKSATVKTIEVLDLADILAREPEWDLVHIDIQGAEAELCCDRIDALSEKVRRVVIGTHSRAIDGALMEVFFRAGWVLENEKPTIYRWRQDAASLEDMALVDGVQVWRNPRLLP